MSGQLSSDRDLAIIGASCRFPGHSNDLTAFWENLNLSRDCVVSTPPDRWNSAFYTDPAKENPGKITTDRCGFVDGVYEFDYEAFGINKKEAENMDPQQKMLLHCTLQTFEDARVSWQGSNTGVYVGIGQAEQLELTTSDLEAINAYSVTGSALSIASNRISYCFDLRGPSLSVDTACSSAMTAMHMAVQAIRRGECSQAIVAGVNLLMSPSVMIQFSKLGVMSPDGRCKSFTDLADGYVRSEGCGVVLIKPLAQALRDHNHVYAVVKGTAINQDGHQTPSLTLPSAEAQQDCFRLSCQDAQVDPRQIFFAEAHATGTKVGDPIEANSIGKVFGEGRKGKTADAASSSSARQVDGDADGAAAEDSGDILRIGGVKTHVGHLECASYMAGLLKCLVMLQHETLVPNLYAGEQYKLNPAIEFERYNMRVQAQHERFDPHLKLMMISSFGFGGANGCSIIQGYRPHGSGSVPRPLHSGGAPQLNGVSNGVEHGNGHAAADSSVPAGPYLFLLSAASQPALDARIKLAKELDPSLPQYDVSYTLCSRALHRNVSIGVGQDIRSTLFAPAKKLADEVSPIVWVFAGQGPQHPEMGRHLYERYPVFRASIDDMDDVYREVSGESLVHDVGVFGSKRGDPNAVYTLQYTLPSLVFLQTALCDLWRSLGVTPVAVFGHSFGEMAAAYAAGVCNKRQLVTTAYHRARLLARIDGNGVMMAVGCSAEQMAPWLAEQPDAAWIAAYNGPTSITVGGTKAAVDGIAARCAAANLFHRILKITNAYHTPLMRPCKEEAIATFAETLAGTGKPLIPYFSTVTASWKHDSFDEHYTWAGIEGPVYFTSAVKGAQERYGDSVLFMEISAHPVLSSYLTECGAKNACMTLHRQQNEQESTLKTLAFLKVQGHSIDFTKIMRPHRALPAFFPYPFQAQFCHKEDMNHKVMREVPSWRELAGREISGITTTFQAKVSLKAQPWTADHVVQGPCIFPAAGYIEMCMEVLGSTSVSGVSIGRAMIVPNDANQYRTVRTVADEERKSVQIFSKLDQWDNGPWTLHVSAAKAAVAPLTAPPAWTEGLRSRCKTEFSQKSVYERFKSVGLQYGPLFQAVTGLWTGDNEAFGVMDVSAIQLHSQRFHVHPALLDATFHVLLGTIRYMYLPYVPTHIRRVQWLVKPQDMGNELHVYARSLYSDNSLEGDIVITDSKGAVVGTVDGMQCTALGQTAEKRPMQPTYTVQWQEMGSSAPFAPTRSAAWSEVVTAQSTAAHQALDNALVAYVSAFLTAAKASPKPLPIASLPPARQRLYALLESLAANHTAELSAIAAIDSLPGYESEAQAVHRLGKGLQELLVDAAGFNKLFSDALVSELFAASATFSPYVRILSEQILQLLKDSTQRVLSVLDASNSNLALASLLLPQLADKQYAGRVKYLYADSTAKTLQEAKAKLAHFSFVDFKPLNVEEDWAKQLSGQAFDVVVANNSLHIAQETSHVLRAVSSVLQPGGALLALETVQAPLWLQLFFTAQKTFVPLSSQQWADALTAQGFRSVNAQSVTGSPFELISAQTAPLVLAPSAAPVAASATVFDTHVAGNDLTALLALAQANYENKEAEYWVLTSGSEDIADSFTAGCPEPDGATFIGFSRTWANECTQHRIRIVDFEAGTPEADRSAWLNTLAAIAPNTLEREFAIRNNRVLVPRFIPFTGPVAAPAPAVAAAAATAAPFRLEVDTVGQISSLRYHSLLTSGGALLDCGEEEVVIEVKAAALNFKDLMLALGMLNNPMGLDKQALRFSPPTAMGLECSGVVLAVGASVSRFSVGDEVFGICDHSLASQVVTHQNFIARKPQHLSHVEAASLPIVFCTSYSGLIDKARIQPGETVLVHSAAGGIGQSSIQLCRSVGAEVIATVGNASKRQYLTERYGVTKFADSHSNAAWKRDVMQLTAGEGVDACINSLKGEAISYGLDCLKVGGRFVEIGKVDILANNPLPMLALLKDISFLSTQLDILMASNSTKVSRFMTAIAELADRRQITPIVDKVYPARDIEPAFRYLMAGQHMGKVMVDFSPACLPASVLPASSVFSAHATYMISGGTGAVGLKLVQWMAEQGARYFILLSRRGEASVRPSELRDLQALSRFGVHVLIAKADVGDAASVKAAFAQARSQGHPSKVGILHLAMVLEDDVLPKQTAARFAPVLACKVDGIRNLVNAFPKEDVAFVVMTSSISSVLGNPAQANYAAANAFLDSYAFWLRAQGYRAKTVNLGSIEDVGVLAEDYKLRMVLNMKGFAGGLTSYGVGQIIDAMLRDDVHAQYVHGSVEWTVVVDAYPIMTTRFSHLVDYTAANSSGAGSADNAVTLSALSAAIAGLLEIPADKIDNKEAITRQGLDSLLAVELSSTLKKKFAITVSQMELLGGMSVEDVFNHSQAAA